MGGSIGSFLGNVGSGLGSFGNLFGGATNILSSLPFVGPVIGATADLFGMGPQAQAQQSQQEAMDYQQQKQLQNMYYGKQIQDQTQAQQTQLWKENAFMSPAEINTARASGVAGLGSERARAYQNMARNLSVRGIGPGSAYSSAPASAIEGGYMSGLSNLENTLINAANKPRFNFPFVNSSSGGGALSSGYPTSTAGYSNPLGMALGMQAGSNALKGMFSTGQSQNPYIYDSMAYEASPYSNYASSDFNMTGVPGTSSGLSDLLSYLGMG